MFTADEAVTLTLVTFCCLLVVQILKEFRDRRRFASVEDLAVVDLANIRAAVIGKPGDAAGFVQAVLSHAPSPEPAEAPQPAPPVPQKA